MRYLIPYCYIALCCTPAEECGCFPRRNVFSPIASNVIQEREYEEEDDDQISKNQTPKNQATSGSDSASRKKNHNTKNINQEENIDQKTKLLYSCINQGKPGPVLSMLQDDPTLIHQKYQGENILISVLRAVPKEAPASELENLEKLVQHIMQEAPHQGCKGLPQMCLALQIAWDKGFKACVRCIAFAKKDNIPVLHYCIVEHTGDSSKDSQPSIEVLKLAQKIISESETKDIALCKGIYKYENRGLEEMYLTDIIKLQKKQRSTEKEIFKEMLKKIKNKKYNK